MDSSHRPLGPPKLLDEVREALRVRHYSIRTEQSYVHWVRRFTLFHGKRHPTEMGAEEITREDFPADFPLADSLNIDYARGGSAVYMPTSLPAVPPTMGDTIVYAVCPANAIKLGKAIIDTMGHYSRPDIFGLEHRAKPYQQQLEALDALPPGQLERIADRHGVQQ